MLIKKEAVQLGIQRSSSPKVVLYDGVKILNISKYN